MATPIQFITEQIKDDAITADKIDLGNGTYDFASGSAILQATTQDQSDDSTKAATTAYVRAAVSAISLSEGAGIDITANKVNVDIDLGSAGLTFSGTGDARKLALAISESTPRGMGLNADGFLEIARTDANGLEIAGDGNLQVKVKTAGGITRDGTNGLALVLNSSFLEVDGSDGLQIVAGAIVTASLADDAVTSAKIADDAVGADQLASNAVVTASIVDANVTAAKLASNAVTNAKLGDDSVGIDEIALTDQYEEFTASGSQSLFELNVSAVLPKFAQVFKNGQRMSLKLSGTPGDDEYTLSGQNLSFGSNVTAGAIIQVSYLSAGTPV